MKFFTSLLLVVAFTFAASEKHPSSDEFINEINSQQSHWKAGKNFDINTPISQLHRLLSVGDARDYHGDFKTVHHDDDDDDDGLPGEFDAREQWRKCESIKAVHDQSACASGWAVATTSAMTDRICIATRAMYKPIISAKNLLACCGEDCGYGCEGGSLTVFAWYYWKAFGIVTGGDYNTTAGCQNYPFAPCSHTNSTESLTPCQKENYDTPQCSKTCDEGWSGSYEDSLTYGDEVLHLTTGETYFMKGELMSGGPLVATMDVYDNFFSYKSGVYTGSSGQVVGQHAVKIIGWGVESGMKYWLCINSWNDSWGDNGTFKILRDVNLCGIEQKVSAGIPRV